MKNIILDTDFILCCARWKIDIVAELQRILDFPHQPVVLAQTFHELIGKPDEQLARHLIKDFKVIPTTQDIPVDTLVFEFPDAVVATQDKELKERLKKAKIAHITIRQKRYLQYSGAGL